MKASLRKLQNQELESALGSSQLLRESCELEALS